MHGACLHADLGVISVPLEAVNARKENSGELYVLSRSGAVQRREVVLGLVTSNEAEIISGVAEGEWVVVGANPRPEKRMIYDSLCRGALSPAMTPAVNAV